MKVIGLLGGMSWESSLVYYKIINEKVKEKLGGHHSCECVMYSVDFHQIKQLQFEGDWEQLTQIMIDAAKKIERGGAEMLTICTNTMHKMVPDIEKNIQIPIVHIADATAEVIKSMGIKKVALLGTRYTMEQDFYKGRLIHNHGIDVVIPGGDDLETIHNIIYDELVLGIIKQESKEAYKRIISTLIQEGARGIVLGCTEIPLLINQSDCDVPVFDTTQIHAEKTVEFALKD
ncbi:MAG: aspartate racemase [Bacteroidetes bacterium GWC2_33_15]|nr:MAG: aspartate racemase [Bacteroidetes bacterium GWA2_33_15]OFX52517.1 MAG: aspartate racemase [Bacteroidetes bacterium GWC2_33_15]OFX65577.1 MAG: aspartate racemase [Bacteroidetes bacterium GWB2_32_14]OFX67599.1 MAG: aspartate racemase [Bacteroidetes bacterium GWD2_33_33]HAN18354.1 aspartate racemase [Bacteroidales bacterium]